MFRIFHNSNQKIEMALKLEKDGKEAEALNLMMEAVVSDSNCKVCRYHMGRIYSKLHEKSNETPSHITHKK